MHSQKDMNFHIMGPFEKSTKTPFRSKASCMNMEDSIEMRPKGLLRGHLELSKKSQNTSLRVKTEEVMHW